jgi:hypothetical protein
MKKTNRKNNTNQIVSWPTGWFTVDSLLTDNSTFKMITLRSHLSAARNERTVVALGTLKPSKGRPKLVFSTTPVSNETIASANDAGVFLDSSVVNWVPVMNIKSSDTNMSDTNISVDTTDTTDTVETMSAVETSHSPVNA